MNPAQKIKTIRVDEQHKALRLDLFLMKKNIVSTRAQAGQLISKNKVFLNDKPLKASYRLKVNELLTIHIPQKKETKGLTPYHFPLDIVFEDKYFLVVNKPAGLVVHPAPGNQEKTLVNILFHQKELSSGTQALRPGIVHRLDKEASGLMLLSKTENSQNHFISLFKNHLIQREYWAISLHPPSPIEDRIETFLSRHPKNRKKFISLKKTDKRAKKAITHYKLFREHESGLSWIKCCLETGRTHQIRIHLSSLSCPIVGDKLYGGQKKLSFIKDSDLKSQIKSLNRIALHAHSLCFPHPFTKEPMTFKSGWPSDLKALLIKLNFSVK